MDETTKPKGLTDTLVALIEDESLPDQVPLSEIVTRLGDQARGVLMVLFCIPNILPSVPGTSAITGLPLVFLTLQMALNVPPWLPGFIARRTLPKSLLKDLMIRATPWLRRVEKLVHPRLWVLTTDTAERVVGVVGLALALTIMLPIPFGNMVPALALMAFSMAFIGKDGAWVLAGIFMTGMTAVMVVATGWAAFMAVMQIAVHWLGF